MTYLLENQQTAEITVYMTKIQKGLGRYYKVCYYKDYHLKPYTGKWTETL